MVRRDGKGRERKGERDGRVGRGGGKGVEGWMDGMGGT